MIKKILLIIILSVNTITWVFAQHCPWDGAMIMVIAVKEKPNDSLSINGLNITVTDSLGNPLYYPYLYYGKNEMVKVIAFQNEVIPHFNVHNVPKTIDVRNYWFAQNNYIIMASYNKFSIKGIKITINDIDGLANGGQFKTKTVILDSNLAFNLCTNYSNWIDGPQGGFKGFPAFIVFLEKEY